MGNASTVIRPGLFSVLCISIHLCMLNNVYRSLVSRSADTEAYLTSNLPFESRESCLHSSTLVRTGILENNGCRQVGRVQTSVDESRQDQDSVLLQFLTRRPDVYSTCGWYGGSLAGVG